MVYIETIEFQKSYSELNTKMKDSNPKFFDYMILQLYVFEYDKGYKVKKIYKTNSKGTKVTYEPIKSKEELDKYINLIKDKVKEFNDKWNDNLCVI